MKLKSPNFRVSIPSLYPLSRQPHPKSFSPRKNSCLEEISQACSSDSRQVKTQLICKYVDHMLSIEWTASEGWLPPRITPYQNLSLDPATCVFHYAFECFEGMKAYQNEDGRISLFRPDKNMARMNKSAARIALPTFEPDSFLKLICKFVSMDRRFIPT